MATRTLRSRRSEPSRPTHQSDATSQRAEVPRPKIGWEFPLSREEKKQRVMYLFQQELRDAEQSSAENLEALQDLLEKRTTPVEPSADAGPAPVPVQIPPRAAKRNVSQARLESCSVGLLAGLAVVVVAWLCQSPTSMMPSNATLSTSTTALAVDMEGVPMVPNITDRVQGMRNEGHVRLQLSNCPEAAWWFSSALQLLSEGGNVSEAYRNYIVGEEGFALVCAKHFKEGAKHLEQHLAFIGYHPGDAHLLNALGYSHFFLQDFQKASEFFELSIRADEHNPVPWSNFAGSRLMQGDVAGAEQAIVQAAENIKRLQYHQDHHAALIAHNAQILQQRAAGKMEHVPWMEIWNGYLY